MDHRLNRLNAKESLVWDKAYEEFCKTGVWNLGDEKMAQKMKVYLVEKAIGGKRLEPIAIKTNFEIAFGLIESGDVGLITEMEIDEVYPEGLGACEHWHFDPNELDSSGERLDEFHRKEVDSESSMS